MEVLVPSPQTTLVILLGASSWPYSPEFQDSAAFANAARRVKAYFLNPRPFGLLGENLLDLFDADKSDDELDVAIGQFLQQRLAAMKADGNPARDLLLYFIGHGGFVGRDSDFYLAIRRTRMDNPRASGLQMMSLADTLTEQARYLRRIIILDCCFASAAFSAFQSGPAQIALEKTVIAFKVGQKAVGFPTKGTTLLCSSNHTSPSLIMPDGSSTMFTKAFLDALVYGSPLQRDQLTLRDVKDRVTDLLSEIRNAPKPVVHSPDQSEGDVADIPFFPNPRIEDEHQTTAVQRQRAKEEDIPQAEERPGHKVGLEKASAQVSPSSLGKIVLPASMPKPRRSYISLTLGLMLLLLLIGTAGLAYWGTFRQSNATVVRDNPHEQPTVTTGVPTKAGLASKDEYETYVAEHGVMFGFNAAHTHTNPYEHQLTVDNVSRLGQKWSASTGGEIKSSLAVANGLSSPAVADGLVYIGSRDGKLYAFDAVTGVQRWSTSTGDKIISSPAVAGGLVYVGSLDGDLYAFDAVTGGQKWTFANGGSESSPVIADGVIYVGAPDNHLYALDAVTGVQKWVASTGSQVYTSSPAVAGGIVYVGCYDNRLYAFDASSGAQKWAVATGNWVQSSPAVAAGVVYVGSADEHLYAFDAVTGVQKWAITVGGWITSSPAVAGGLVYVGSHNSKLYAFDTVTGVQKWSTSTSGEIDSSPTVADGVVYVGSQDGKLYAFDASSGVQKWSGSTGAGIDASSPAIEGGVVYIGSFDHKIYAFSREGS